MRNTRQKCVPCEIRKPKIFGVVSFGKSARIKDIMHRVARLAHKTGHQVLFHPGVRKMCLEKASFAPTETALFSTSDVLISIGGDGTFLSAAHQCLKTGKPLVGINMGGLGFLTDIGPENLEENLLKLFQGKFRTIRRSVLKAVLMRNGSTKALLFALNDVFINRIDKPKLSSISAWYNNQFINDFQADGVIVATPAGSTAYSLAAGGPILAPEVNALLLTPICPHSLTERPVIFPGEGQIRLRINPRNPSLLVSADGRDSIRLKPGDEIVITSDQNQACLIQLTEGSFFESLRSKLIWGTGSLNRKRTVHAA
jgi:NAD+ kinase